MKILLLIILIFRVQARGSNHKARNEPKILAIILRSAKDEVHDNFADVKNYDDLLERVTLSTTEPPEFLDNFFFQTVRPPRTKASLKHYLLPKELTMHQKLQFNTNPPVTFGTVTLENTRMIVHNPYIIKTYDSDTFLEHVFSNGMWNHLHNDLNMSYVTDPIRAQSSNWYLTTRTWSTTQTTPYELHFYKNPLIQETSEKPFDFVWGDEMASLK